MAVATTNDAIDLRAIFKKLLSKWWWFFITVSLSLALGVAYIKTTPKQYMVQSVMLMGERARNSYSAPEEFIKGTSYLSGTANLEDKVSVLTSRTNIKRTLERLDFGIRYYETANFLTTEKFDYPPFKVQLDTVAIQVVGIPVHVSVDRSAGTYRVWAKGTNVRLYNVQKQEVIDDFLPEYGIDQIAVIGKPFVGDHLSFTIDFPADRDYSSRTKYHFELNALEDLVVEYLHKTFATPLSKESNVVVMQIQGEVVSKERTFLNKLMNTYIDGELYKQQQKGLKTINFIDDQIGTVADTLRQVEGSMRDFRGGSNVMLSAASTSDALLQDRSRLEDERSSEMRKRTYCASVLEKVRSSSDPSSDLRNVPAPSSSGIDDPVLNQLVIEITRLSAELAALKLTTVKSNPTVIAMERKIRNLTGSLEQTAASLIEQADISLADLNARLGRINYQFSAIPENARTLGVIERKFKLSDNLYNYLMEKRAEAGIAIASDQIEQSIVDEARMEGIKHVSPNKKTILGGAFLLGMLLPVLLIVVRDFFNDRILDVEELKRATKLPLLGLIPTSKRKRVLPEEPKSMLAEAFRTARINLQYLNANVDRQVIGITSSSSGEGKTFCAVNLAAIMALSGKRTLLIDADMRRPNVLKTLDMPEGAGLSTWLIGEAVLDQMVRKTDIPGLDVIGAGPIPPNPLELAEGPRLADLFVAMRERYDQIVVDASPVGLVSEYVVLMRHVDVTLFVVRERHTRRSALRTINEMVEEKKIGHVDLLMNDVKASHAEGYGYYTK